MYEEEIEFLKDNEEPNNEMNDRDRLSVEELEIIEKDYPGIPPAFLSYLKEIGWGSFRECQYGIFKPCYFEDLYDVGVEFEKMRYIAFGHNFSGDTSLFDSKNNHCITEFWHDFYEFVPYKEAFREYIRKHMLMKQ